MTKRLPIDPDVLARFCMQHQICRLSLFGSMLTDAVNPASDIDLLVEFEPGKEPGLIGMGQLEAELAGLLGRRVDLRTAQDLSRYFRDEVLRTAEELWR
jgi:predicted nucleotidyltransferase